jgi:hypothetical protein
VRIISMAWVWPAFVARRKNRTRRDWKTQYAESVQVGERFSVVDRLPRVKGWHRIGVLEISEPVVYEPIALMPDEDYEREGLAFMGEHGVGLTPGDILDFEGWRQSGKSYWVVSFEILEVFADAEARLQELLLGARRHPLIPRAQ